MKTHLIGLVVLISVGLISCNKTNSYSNRLSGETWTVKSLTIDGVAEEEDHLPELEFEDCDIYDEDCEGEWHIEDEHAEFAWQFNENGSVLSIANLSVAEHDHDHDHEGEEHEDEEEDEHVEPVDQCQDLSGTYDVDEMSKTEMKISSSATIGFDGTSVVIELERK